MTQVNSKKIKAIKLLKDIPFVLRLDFFPFVFLYLYFLLEYRTFYIEDLWSEKILQALCFPICVFIHFLVYLVSHWSISFRCLVRYKATKKIESSQHVAVFPQSQAGTAQVCKLFRSHNQYSFLFQNRTYFWSEQQKVFCKRDYPVHHKISDYLEHKGLLDSEKRKELFNRYGKNKFLIPDPQFKELFKEQALAPFFVFQVFCVLLWCLDEYWYFSIFTLVLLVASESMIVKKRLKNLSHLREIGVKPYVVEVYRGSWIKVKSTELLPGDIVNLKRNTIPSCDLLLIEGTCIVNESMLTGESVPQLKENVKFFDQEKEFNLKNYKANIIFGGTKVIQHSNQSKTLDGCKCYVLRTGFGTSQGKLMRTILHSSQRVTANNLDALFFILFLLFFALLASGYVFVNGLKDQSRSRYKLVLNCVLILTSVIPPELPMQLSLAVNTSVVSLSKLAIFCTEPFRIPFAGKIDVCCFDKTGTLTSNKITLRGIAGINLNKNKEKEKGKGKGKSQSNSGQLTFGKNLPDLPFCLLGGCHSLVFLDKQIIGDPTEKATMKGIGLDYTGLETTRCTRNNKKFSIRIIQRHPFASKLKRMSTITEIYEGVSDKRYYSICKGAPETVKEFIKDLPANYEDIYKKYMLEGSRVIAYGYKELNETSIRDLRQIPRKDLEKDLIFGGFLIFMTSNKHDSKEIISELISSEHKIVMITGDNILTACHIAKELKIIHKKELFININEDADQNDNNNVEIIAESSDKTVKYNIGDLKQLKINLDDYNLCLSGTVMKRLIALKKFDQYLKHIVVFARIAPEQKEYILIQLKKRGFTTSMCGDGTNDVGALKQSHVGVSLLNSEVLQDIKSIESKKKQLIAKSNSNRNKIKNKNKNSNKRNNKNNNASRKLTWAEKLRKNAQEAEQENLQVKLGDASIASPFTSKKSSISCMIDIIRQGRCTLVTTLQMYKILALNCLITAYSLSVLYLEGIKQGDQQATISGIFITVCFLFITRPKPLDKLYPERPITKIFSFYVMFSILFQFTIHLFAIIFVCKMSYPFITEPLDIEKDFEPNVLNGSIFILSIALQVITCAVNYIGRPFMLNLQENKKLFYSLIATFSLTLVLSLDIVRPLNIIFQLDPFPSWKFRFTLTGIIILDLVLSFAIEKGLYWIFKHRPSKKNIETFELIHKNRNKKLKKEKKEKKIETQKNIDPIQRKKQSILKNIKKKNSSKRKKK
ncbi:manganese-transporting atpase 13a1 [Anaeramoeba flamelloides]|uniref:Manganese-transporting atpase 13a1 n=1 Tax=Anaeramoeba flamelloides TaxID=1746091 RepID=A0AAV7Z7A6_9EUKA|nr:manganese-transporting atpase 13a1 [Anaeramoeba flamelloides]